MVSLDINQLVSKLYLLFSADFENIGKIAYIFFRIASLSLLNVECIEEQEDSFC